MALCLYCIMAGDLNAVFRQGLELLFGEASFWQLVTTVLEAGALILPRHSEVRGERWGEAELVRIKAAIWGVANTATSPSASELDTLQYQCLDYKSFSSSR